MKSAFRFTVVTGCLALALTGSVVAQTEATLAVGQVWTYHHREQDSGSFLRIGRIEEQGGKRIFHISVVGIKMGCKVAVAGIGHIPVAEEALRKSVTELRQSNTTFPDIEAGIAEWRANKGGVFTIELREIANVLENAVCGSA